MDAPLDEAQRARIMALFPDYVEDPGTTNFTTMFFPRGAFRLQPTNNLNLRLLKARVANMEQQTALDVDRRRAFDSAKPLRLPTQPVIRIGAVDEAVPDSDDEQDEEEVDDADARLQQSTAVGLDAQSSLELLPWEDDIIWDADSDQDKSDVTPARTPGNTQLLQRLREAEGNVGAMSTAFTFRNKQLERGDWVNWIIWDENDTNKSMTIEDLLRDAEDPALLVDVHAILDSSLRTLRLEATDAYNLSNDKYYDTKPTEGTSSKSKTTAFLQHAMPAVKLVTTFYPTDLTNKELRSIHRPYMRISPNLEIKFSRVKALKKKRLKGKENMDLLKTAKDVSLRDSAQFCLFEYSEEHPIVLSNPGMASIIYNYYRKRDEKDPTNPPSDFGAANILEPNDASPFFGFGDVGKGEAFPVLFNNLYRAPLFRHSVKETDFLVIKHTYKNQTKFFLREIPHLFVVGQQLPMVEVPPPQSRVLAEYRRNRIKVAVYRLMRKKTDNLTRGVRFSELHVMFPQYGEIPLKSKLKEFMEGRGLASGHWRLKGNSAVPSEEEIRKLVTPELVCVYESLCASLRHLQDLGINKISDDGDGGDGGGSGGGSGSGSGKQEGKEFELEQDLAVWKLTKNFDQARQGKVMLKLRGEGDPTGCGEGFSFLKAGAKEVYNGMTFDARGRFSVSEQKMAYEQEIKRIWDRQVRSLSSSVDPKLTREQMLEELAEDDRTKRPNSSTRAVDWDDDTSSFGGTSRNEQTKRRRKLVIRRKVGGPNGPQIKEEVVRDPKVINAYLRLQQKMKELQEDYSKDTGSLEKQMLSAIRKEAKAAKDYMIHDFLTHRSQVQCSRCGMMGHIKTNRQLCPAYRGENETPGNVKAEAGSGTPSATNTMPPRGNMGSAGGGAGAAKKRKEDGESAPRAPKQRKRHADVELSELFEKVLVEVLAMPEAQDFLQAPSDPNYRSRIQTSIDLNTIRTQNKELHYRSAEEFLADIRLMARNSEEFNGLNAPETERARTITGKVVQDINKNIDQLRVLEEEIASGKAKKTKNAKARASGAAGGAPPPPPQPQPHLASQGLIPAPNAPAPVIGGDGLTSMLLGTAGGLPTAVLSRQPPRPPAAATAAVRANVEEDEDVDVMSM